MTTQPPADLRQWFATIIRQKRHAKHWRQEDLAEASGFSHKYIGEVERGVKNPTIDAYERILLALDISIHSLIFDSFLTLNLPGLVLIDTDAVKKFSMRGDGSPPVGPPRASEGVPPPAGTGRAGPRMRKPARSHARKDGARSIGSTARQARPRPKRKGP